MWASPFIPQSEISWEFWEFWRIDSSVNSVGVSWWHLVFFFSPLSPLHSTLNVYKQSVWWREWLKSSESPIYQRQELTAVVETINVAAILQRRTGTNKNTAWTEIQLMPHLLLRAVLLLLSFKVRELMNERRTWTERHLWLSGGTHCCINIIKAVGKKKGTKLGQ